MSERIDIYSLHLHVNQCMSPTYQIWVIFPTCTFININIFQYKTPYISSIFHKGLNNIMLTLSEKLLVNYYCDWPNCELKTDNYGLVFHNFAGFIPADLLNSTMAASSLRPVCWDRLYSISHVSLLPCLIFCSWLSHTYTLMVSGWTDRRKNEREEKDPFISPRYLTLLPPSLHPSLLMLQHAPTNMRSRRSETFARLIPLYSKWWWNVTTYQW